MGDKAKSHHHGWEWPLWSKTFSPRVFRFVHMQSNPRSLRLCWEAWSLNPGRKGVKGTCFGCHWLLKFYFIIIPWCIWTKGYIFRNKVPLQFLYWFFSSLNLFRRGYCCDHKKIKEHQDMFCGGVVRCGGRRCLCALMPRHPFPLRDQLHNCVA